MGRGSGVGGVEEAPLDGGVVRLLGPVQVTLPDGDVLDLGGPKPRAVLALLALSPGEVVSADRLVDGVWGTEAPDSARRSLQTHVSNLRRSLGGVTIDQRGSGYALDVDAGQVDVVRFRTLTREARESGDPGQRLDRLDRALELVRGAPLDGLGDAPFVSSTRAGLEEDILDATERRIDTLLELGRHGEVTRQLEALVSEHPLREKLRAQLMVAQYRAGRQAAALDVYEQARVTLGEELGIDPSPQLQDLHQRILQQDPALDAQPTSQPVMTRPSDSAPPAGAPPSLSSDELVGREAEVEQLRGLLAAVKAGQPRLLLLGGEAGIGKSRLLSALVEGAARRGFTTMVGHCIDLGDTALPFAPVAQALRTFARGADDATVDRVAGPGRSELARIVPEFGGGAAHTDVRQEGEARAHLFAAVMDMLGRLSEQQPVVLAFEDIHWADQSTLDLLDYVARNLLSEPLLVVASFRTDELHRRHPLRGPISELGRLRQVTRIDLEPFTRDDVGDQLARILDRRPDPGLVDAITERSGGNPFYVEELVAAVREQQDAAGADVLPPALHDVVAGRLERLPDDARQVLSVAAVAGERVDHRLLELVDRLDDLNLVAALRQAVEHGVLLTDAEGYRFRHALVREVIYDDLLPGERTSVHRVLAETLEAHPDAAAGGAQTVDAEVAHHWYVAHDRERALAASLRAATRATDAAAYSEALRNYERALELWGAEDAVVGGTTRNDVLDAAADVAHLAGETRRAVNLLRELLEAVPDDADPTELGLLHERLGNSLVWIEDGHDAIKEWERALELVPEQPPTAARARVLTSYARGLWVFQTDEAMAASEEALRIAREVGDRRSEAAALLQYGSNLAPAGQLEAAIERLRAALALAEERRSPREIGECYGRLSAVLVRGGRASEGADVALEGLQRVHELGVERLYFGLLSGNATSGLFWAGRWDEAGDFLAQLGDRTANVSWLLLVQARLQAYEGDLDAARRTLAKAVAEGADRDSRYLGVVMAMELFDGQLDAAHEAVLSARRQDVMAHAATVNSRCALSLQIEAERLHQPGYEVDGPELHGLADAILAETTDRFSGGLGHAEPWRLTAVAEHSRIADHPSPEQWRAALESWRDIDWPYQVAYSSFRLAEAEFEAGDDGSAPLREAAGIAGRLGAQPLLRDIQALAERHVVELTEAAP